MVDGTPVIKPVTSQGVHHRVLFFFTTQKSLILPSSVVMSFK